VESCKLRYFNSFECFDHTANPKESLALLLGNFRDRDPVRHAVAHERPRSVLAYVGRISGQVDCVASSRATLNPVPQPPPRQPVPTENFVRINPHPCGTLIVDLVDALFLLASTSENRVVPPPYSNWSLLEPSTLKIGILSDLRKIELDGCN
jgi:hypothetical protein